MQDKKKYYDIPEEKILILKELGYRLITPEDQVVFDPYYDSLNDHWSSSSEYLNLIGWQDSFVVYMKEEKGMMFNIIYLRTDDYFIAGPFLGTYSMEKMPELVKSLKSDFTALGQKMILMDVAKWMLPYYEASGYSFEVEDDRDLQEYIFTYDNFKAGMDTQDDRYRYNYFKRKYSYETQEIIPENAEEIDSFMEKVWCSCMKCEDCHFGCLKGTIANVVKNFRVLRVKGIIVRVDGETAGICIVSNRNGLGIYNYKNAINRIKGLNEYLLRECFERYMDGAKIINYTEDMGIENLRYYKTHMAPEYGLFPRLTLNEK